MHRSVLVAWCRGIGMFNTCKYQMRCTVGERYRYIFGNPPPPVPACNHDEVWSTVKLVPPPEKKNPHYDNVWAYNVDLIYIAQPVWYGLQRWTIDGQIITGGRERPRLWWYKEVYGHGKVL